MIGVIFIIMKNTPYKKQYDKSGKWINPITKEEPYLNKPNVSLLKLIQYRAKGRFRIWEANYNKYFKGKIIVRA